MRNRNLLFPLMLILISLAFAACDDKTKTTDRVPLTEEETAWFTAYHPTATHRIIHQIPVDLLSEKDVTMGNTTFWSLYDAEKTLLGYARLIGDPLSCASGKCKAIKFFLLFDTNLDYSAVFHPAGKSGDFYKGVEGDLEADELFTQADLELLHSLLLDPPAKLLEVGSTDELVDAETTATYEDYWDVVVRQAAYTTYYVLQHMVTSRELMQGLVTE